MSFGSTIPMSTSVEVLESDFIFSSSWRGKKEKEKEKETIKSKGGN